MDRSVSGLKPCKWGGYYYKCSPAFERRVLWDISRSLKASQPDASIVIEYDEISYD